MCCYCQYATTCHSKCWCPVNAPMHHFYFDSDSVKRVSRSIVGFRAPLAAYFFFTIFLISSVTLSLQKPFVIGHQSQTQIYHPVWRLEGYQQFNLANILTLAFYLPTMHQLCVQEDSYYQQLSAQYPWSFVIIARNSCLHQIPIVLLWAPMLISASQLICMYITDQVKLMQKGTKYTSALKKIMLSSVHNNFQLPWGLSVNGSH